MNLFQFICILLFCCWAFALGVGFLAGRWYERNLNETPSWRPSFVPDRSHPERMVPIPLTGRRHLAVVADPHDPSPAA